MSGSKPFGAAEDYPERSPISGKPILVVTPGVPVAFTDLSDTPANYTGQAGKFPKVNATETGLEYDSLSDGAQGPTGVQGTQGTHGVQGTQGTIGSQGAQGIQ